ncbi:MAG: cbb3-type cytochrome c oxidase subunit I [Pusillimonas sp.]
MNTHTVSTRDNVGRVTASTPARYVLPETTSSSRRLARAWLWLALAALLGSGLFSVLLVLARTPGIHTLLPAGDFFRVALVVHVDLSVLVWFTAIAGMLWSLNLRPALTPGNRLAAQLALALCAAGALGMALAPFVDSGAAIMANYIPMIDSNTFRIALLVFAAGGLLLVLLTMICTVPIGPAVNGTGALRFGLHASAVAAAVALLAFGWSMAVMPAGLPADAYYEILYWGGGHALQFTWTLLMLVSWLVLVQACGGQVPLSPRIVLLLFTLALAGVFVTPLAYLVHDIGSVEHRGMHTWAMRLGGGMAIAPLILAVLLGLAPLRRLAPALQPLRAAVLASLLLFVAGGLIGLSIAGSNVRIPAHYHGSIVGVTLALMGMIYWLLPRLGYAAPSGRMALLQPWLYGGGQLLHIIGLMWSGGYGVQRKVAGAQQVLRTGGEIAGMGLMGLGGLLAIAGGLLFALVVIRSMRGLAATPTKQRDGAA